MTQKTADKNAKKKEKIRELADQSELIENAEKPNWVALKRAIFDLAYEIGRQAAATKAAHAEFSTLEEGGAPPTSHELYAGLQSISERMRAPSLDEASALSTVILEETPASAKSICKAALPISTGSEKPSRLPMMLMPS